MPYDMRNPGANPGHEGNDFNMLMDEITTYLWEGEAWHEKAANETRKISIRGVGRWHEAEGCYDAKERVCLEKLFRDKLGYAPMVDMASVDKAYKYTMTGPQDFKNHFQIWIDREKKFIECLDAAIAQAGMVDMELYKKLCCLVDEVQNEAMRAKMVHDRLELSGWNGHDIGVVSKWLHEYFEKEYDGGKIDFNIG